MFTWSAAKPACIPKALPVRRWQARQWQIETANGSPFTSSVSCPQWHDASRVAIATKPSRIGRGGLRAAPTDRESASVQALVDGGDQLTVRRVPAELPEHE